MSETTIDLTALRAPFAPEEIGKLPRVTCADCSKKENRGQCGNHKKIKCRECGSYISEQHIHIDYVGHADVTIRLNDVDPSWTWDPKATDPDPEVLKAAVATGNPEIVRLVYDNAPPRFERDRNGFPVSLWITLTVGGDTKTGVGSCPAGQFDAEKVLIGDALRNAAMRFGVATVLWAKGDRAAPVVENATGTGEQSDPRAPRPEQGRRGQVTKAAQPKDAPADAADALAGETDWGVALAGITSDEDADRVEADIKAAHDAGRLKPVTANALRKAIAAKRGKFTGSVKAATG